MKGDKFLSKAVYYYCIHRMSIIVKKNSEPVSGIPYTTIDSNRYAHMHPSMCCLQSFNRLRHH